MHEGKSLRSMELERREWLTETLAQAMQLLRGKSITLSEVVEASYLINQVQAYLQNAVQRELLTDLCRLENDRAEASTPLVDVSNISDLTETIESGQEVAPQPQVVQSHPIVEESHGGSVESGENERVSQSLSGKKPMILAQNYQRPIARHEAFQSKASSLSTFGSERALERLEQGLTINDRTRFIRELFQGNAALFSRTVERIDTAESLSDALAVLHQYYTGDQDSPVLGEFVTLIGRCFK